MNNSQCKAVVSWGKAVVSSEKAVVSWGKAVVSLG